MAVSVAVAASVLAGAGGTASAAPLASSASTDPGNCASVILCLYSRTDYDLSQPGTASDVIQAESPISDLGGFDNATESLVNETSSRWCFFSGTNFTGLTFEIHGGEDWPSLPGYIDNNIKSLRPGPCPTIIGPIKGLQGRCLDIRGGTAGNHVPVDLWSCNGGGGQQWQVNTNGFGTVSNGKYCLGSESGGTANGTPVDVYQCNGSSGQNWTLERGGELVQQSSGRCLDDTNGSTSGAPMQIWDCFDSANQRFSVPN